MAHLRTLLVVALFGLCSLPRPAGAQVNPLESVGITGDKDEASASPSSAEDGLHERIKQWTARADGFRNVLEQAKDKLVALDDQLKNSSYREPPTLDTTLDGEGLNHALAVAEQELEVAVRDKQRLDGEATALSERKRALPGLLADANERLRKAQDGAEQLGEVSSDKAVTLPALRVEALEAEVAAHEAELRSQEVRGAQLERLRQIANLRLAHHQALVQALRERLRNFQHDQILEEATRARALVSDDNLPTEIRGAIVQIADENTEMARAWNGDEGLDAKIASVQERLSRARLQVERVESEYERIAAKVDAASMADSVGALLRKERAQAPDVGMYQRFVRMRQDQIAEAQLQQIRLQERRDDLANVEERVAEALAEVRDTELLAPQREQVSALLRELYASQLKYLDLLIADHEAYFQGLVDFDVEQRQLIASSQALIDFIDEHVLWVPSGSMADLSMLTAAQNHARELFSGHYLDQVSRAFRTSLSTRPGRHLTLALLLLAQIFFSLHSRRLHARLAEREGSDGSNSIPTLLALLLTVTVALGPPLILLLLARLVGGSADATLYVRAWVTGLSAGAVLWLSLRAVRTAARHDGLLQGHVGLPAEACRRLSRQVWMLATLAVPVTTLIFVLEGRGNDEARESLGRLLFALLMGLLLVFGHLILRHLQPALESLLGPRMSRRRTFALSSIRGLSWLVPSSLLLSALLGFYWTALQLAVRIHFTLLLLSALLLLSHFLSTWAERAQRRVAVARSQEALQALAQESDPLSEGRISSPESRGSADRQSIHVEQLLDLSSVSTQTHRLTTAVLVTIGVIGILGIWADLLPAAGVLRQVELWDATREVTVVVPDDNGSEHRVTEQQQLPITLADLSLSLLIAGFAWLLLRNLPGLIEVSLFQRLQAGERYAYATIIKYAIGMVGATLSLDALGIGWSSIQWLVAAVGLGLGFGLQEIFANFVSGLIILFERPIRVGDTVTVGEVSGTVSRIRIRATWITGFDRKELVVPNKEFVSNRLVNWTLSDQVLRVEIPVGIAYGSDTRRAIAILDKLARRNSMALREPQPRVWFRSFGDSALLFELRVFVAHPDHVLAIRHELNLSIDDAFREAKIEIAFPQLDLHVRDVPRELCSAKSGRGEGNGQPSQGKGSESSAD